MSKDSVNASFSEMAKSYRT